MDAQLLTLSNQYIRATFTNYGARITSLIVADKNGNDVDVVAGFDSIEDYLKATGPYYGATIGRFANRIAKGKFNLNARDFQLPVNNGENSLHGGGGFHSKVWDVVEVGDTHIIMEYISPDMEDGYPGKITVTVKFSITDKTWQIAYQAITDKDTIINLTNHAFFNLNGEGTGDVLGHLIHINASSFTPVNQNLIPTGEIASLEGTPFDFKELKPIGLDIDADDEQLNFGRGFDHNYVLNKADNNELTVAARAIGDKSGVMMECLTSEPGMQFYTGNFMNGSNIFRGGSADEKRTCFCFETQHFPDSPNQAHFPSTVLRPGDIFRSTTQYRFGVA